MPAEVALDVGVAARLVAAQHPDLAGLPVRFLGEGWDNALFRLGEDLLLRLPRRAIGARWVAKEQRWLPHLAERLPVAVPAPVRVGAPGGNYPFPWSIVPWVEGRVAGEAPLDDAAALGAFLAALHRPAPAEAIADPAVDNPFRACPVGERAAAVAERLARRGGDAVLAAAFDAGAGAAPWAGPPVWVHGDLHPFNVLTRQGRLAAVLDWGDMFVGDPAVDLAGVWALLPPDRHGPVRAALDHDAATWARGRAWAVYFGLMLSEAGTQGAGPAFHAAGERILDRVRAPD